MKVPAPSATLGLGGAFAWPSAPQSRPPSEAAGRWAGSSRGMIQVFRTMYMSGGWTTGDPAERQNRVFFQISAPGTKHTGRRGLALRLATTGSILLPRSYAVPHAGSPPSRCLLAAVAPPAMWEAAAARCRRNWSAPQFNIVSSSSPTGHTVPASRWMRRGRRRLHPRATRLRLVTSGEGATSEGESWEALNAACLERLPVGSSWWKTRLRHLGSRGSRPPAAISPRWWARSEPARGRSGRARISPPPWRPCGGG